MSRDAARLFSVDEFARFEPAVSQRLGLRVDDGSRERLHEALDRRMRLNAVTQPEHYRLRLEGESADVEWRALAQELSIGESYFFRGSDHFRALASTVLPERLQARATSRSLRVLCAGCSSGEEPYSIAMSLMDRLPDIAQWNVEIVGADISPALLAKAERGVYTGWSLRDVSPDIIRRHFHQAGHNRFELNANIRRMVRFEERNLMDTRQALPSQAYDLVFCRNVLIYFGFDAMQTVLRRFAQTLAPGGYLFLGHSESLRGLSRDFQLCQTDDAFYYRLRAAGDVQPQDSFWDAAALELTAAPAALPAASPALDDGAWFDAIQRSTDRIASLSRGSSGAIPCAVSELPRALNAARDGIDAALQLFRAERYAETADALHTLPDLDGSVEAQLLLGAAQHHRGRSGEAESAARRVLALDEFNAEALYLLALCREQGGDFGGAARQAQAASYLDPDFALPHWLDARLARRRGDTARAERALGQALSLLSQEDGTRVLLFGGGFSRAALIQLCRAEQAGVRKRA